METMRYKPSDKVRIKSLDWYNKNKDKDGNIVFSSKVPQFSWNVNVRTVFTKDMVKFCGKVVTIESVWPVNYSIIEGTYRYYFTDEMIEGLAEEEVSYYTESEWLKHEISLPDGYIFKDENGNIINATKIVLEKKKKEYPKTYEECCKVLDFCGEYFFTTYEGGIHLPENDNIVSIHQILKSVSILTKLLICRNAYWKIAGDEMGLGKPWEPTNETVCCISRSDNVIKCSYRGGKSNILEFPDPEMRDAFYENFGPDIEICKELL